MVLERRIDGIRKKNKTEARMGQISEEWVRAMTMPEQAHLNTLIVLFLLVGRLPWRIWHSAETFTEKRHDSLRSIKPLLSTAC